MSTAAARITASGHTHSRYSCGPRLTPASSVTRPPASARFQSASEILARRGLQSGTRDVRETTYSARPTRTRELQPKMTRLMCAGRRRPNETQAYGRNSGQCSLIDVISPMVVPTSNQTVADVTYSNVTRTVVGSAEGEATRPGSRIRVLIVVLTYPLQSKAGAKSKQLVLRRCRSASR